jgi:hypothetical protein
MGKYGIGELKHGRITLEYFLMGKAMENGNWIELVHGELHIHGVRLCL